MVGRKSNWSVSSPFYVFFLFSQRWKSSAPSRTYCSPFIPAHTGTQKPQLQFYHSAVRLFFFHRQWKAWTTSSPLPALLCLYMTENKKDEAKLSAKDTFSITRKENFYSWQFKCDVSISLNFILCSFKVLVSRGGTEPLFCKSRVGLKSLHSSPKSRPTSPKSYTLSFES